MKKSSHSFLCRDDVWERVQALAKHRKVSTDDVVQAALVQLFVRKRRPPPPVTPSANRPAPAPPSSPEESMSNTVPDLSMSASQAADFAAGMREGPQSDRAPTAVPKAPSSRPPQAARPGNLGAPVGGLGRAPIDELRPLYLQCDGEWYMIDKDEFVIGRGKKYSDLAIKDANISRRHCAISRIEGRYYMRDLGSTNGIEQGGVRVNDHEITENSVFYLCSHELRFSYLEPAGPVIQVGT